MFNHWPEQTAEFRSERISAQENLD